MQQPSFDLSKQGLAGAKITALVKNAARAADGELKTVTPDPHGCASRNSLIDAYELNIEGVSAAQLRSFGPQPRGPQDDTAR